MHNHWRRIEQLGGSYWFYLSFISYESRGSRPKYPAEIPGPGPVITALKYSKKAKGRDRTHIFNLHIWIKHVPYLQTWCWTDYRRINSWLEVFKCWKRQINFSCCSFSFFNIFVWHEAVIQPFASNFLANVKGNRSSCHKEVDSLPTNSPPSNNSVIKFE